MGDLETKSIQTFQVGVGPRKFAFKRAVIKQSNRKALSDFYDAVQGSYQSFTYNAPNPDGSTTAYKVIFETQVVSFTELVNACQVGFNFLECPDPTAAPTYTVTGTPCTRFPNTTLATALASDVQQIIPLVHIVPRRPAYDATATYTVNDWVSYKGVTYISMTEGNIGNEPGVSGDWAVGDLYLSDRRVTIDTQLYLPRLLGIGDPSSDTLMSQNINGQSDQVQFQFGNADRAMTQLANNTDLKYASIDLCLYHVQSGILLQLWKGVIQGYSSDGTAVFPVTCSDGFFQIMNQYPKRQISRQCWKTFNDGLNCPWAAQSGIGDSTGCDYYLESANGCQAHGMAKYFGGQQCDPQGVFIKDDSTGFLGFERNRVTATSIVSDTIWGISLPEIWCNSGGNQANAFITNALVVDYRDESSYADSLGIVGAGPIGGFSNSGVAYDANNYPHIVSPMVDGFTWQGFKVDLSNWSITKDQVGVGLRQVQGNDPANPTTDYFSLGQGTPQVWEPNNYAAGVALCELRIQKPSGVQPSTPDQHQMTVPLDYGLAGWVFDASGTRTAVQGLTNPYWICVNMLLRAMSVQGYVPCPPNLTSTAITLPSSSYFGYVGENMGLFVTLAVAGLVVMPVFGVLLEVYALVSLIGSAFTGNAFSVPMSNAANQAEVILRDNVSLWQNLSSVYKTTANRTIFAANFDTIWNCYTTACNTIIAGDPNGSDAKKALNRSIGDRQRGGKFDWYAAYRDPIANDATPGDSMTVPDLSAEQLATFDLPSLVNADSWTDASGATHTGAGCAQIADLQVPAILGDGNETQFQFQGVISSPKPFRDWLNEVLNCCLGYFTWEFGKLKLGCRINASAVSAFTKGNMLYQSLKLAPIEAAFEHLVISYADVNYQYQANTAEYSDKDHAAYYGRADAPLTAQMHSVGISTLSQALRVAATRVREEIGGINAAEWQAARVATFETTILALETEVGQVVSITHPDVPGGSGDYRIQSWKLKKDWSIEIQAKTVTPSMYNLDVGPKPIDVVAAPLPVLFYPQPLGQWAPYEVPASSSDAIYPNEWTFDLAQSSITMADGTINANLTVTGKLPANQFIPNCGPVGITGGNITHSTTGGYLPDLTMLRVAVCAMDANGVCSPPSPIVLVRTDVASATNQFTINGIQWPSNSSITGYVVCVSDMDDLICAQQTGTGKPSSITVTGPLVRSTWMLPDPDIKYLRMKVKGLLHGGVIGASIDSVSGSTIVSHDTIDVDGLDNWAGRKLMIAGRNEASTPFMSFNINAFDPATGTYTLDRAVTGVEVADVLIVSFKGYDNTSNPYVFADSGMSSASDMHGYTPAPHTGLETNVEVGMILRVIAGYNRGATAKVVSNLATSYTLDKPLPIDDTSIVVVEAPNWYTEVDATVSNSDPSSSTNIVIPTENYEMTSLLVAAFIVDKDGNESPDGDNCVRLTYVFGSGGKRVVTDATDTQQTTDGRVYFDSRANNIVFQLIEDVQVYGQPLLLQKISTDTNTVAVNAADGDTFADGTNTQVLAVVGDALLLRF